MSLWSWMMLPAARIVLAFFGSCVSELPAVRWRAIRAGGEPPAPRRRRRGRAGPLTEEVEGAVVFAQAQVQQPDRREDLRIFWARAPDMRRSAARPTARALRARTRRELERLLVHLDGLLVVLLQRVHFACQHGAGVSWRKGGPAFSAPSCMKVESCRWIEFAFWKESIALSYALRYIKHRASLCQISQSSCPPVACVGCVARLIEASGAHLGDFFSLGVYIDCRFVLPEQVKRPPDLF